MSNDLTTRQVSEGAVKGQSLLLGGAKKLRAPAFRDNVLKQVEDLHGKLFESEAALRQLTNNPEKAKEIAEETVNYFKKFVQEVQVDLRYDIDEVTEEVVIKVFEKGTDKLIRQIPPEAILHLKERINDLLGIIYDETA